MEAPLKKGRFFTFGMLIRLRRFGGNVQPTNTHEASIAYPYYHNVYEKITNR